jgi:hypothetical protein
MLIVARLRFANRFCQRCELRWRWGCKPSSVMGSAQPKPQSFRSKSGSLAKFTAIRLASSFVSNFAADLLPGFFSVMTL